MEQRTDAEYYMRLLVDRVPSMLAYWDRDLRCRFANRAYEAWFGADPDRLIGTHVRDLLGPQIFELNHPMMLRALQGERQVFERLIPGPDGTLRQSLAEYIPDMVAGEVQGFLVQVTNLAELKETKAALHRETELRSQIESHARQLEVLLRERTEMLNVLAHEVRQPLNNASAALHSADDSLVVRSDAYASSQVLHAQKVIREVLHQIDNTLAVASLLARSDAIERADVDIDTLISIATGDMPAAERDRFVVVRRTATRTALMDMSLMRLALRNLMLNAINFSASRTPITVTVSDSDEPPALQVAVTDHGPGIPVEFQHRLFTRGAPGQGAGRHGLGLGLYIVDKVMKLHRGSVSVDRTGPSGTTISLNIPQTDDDEIRSR